MVKSRRKIYFIPKTRLGKISCWIGLSAFILLYINYWISMAANLSFILPGIIIMSSLCICGITSLISILKNKDYAVLLFLSSLLGLFGLFFVIAELIFSH